VNDLKTSDHVTSTLVDLYCLSSSASTINCVATFTTYPLVMPLLTYLICWPHVPMSHHFPGCGHHPSVIMSSSYKTDLAHCTETRCSNMRHVGSHWHLTVHKETKIAVSRNMVWPGQHWHGSHRLVCAAVLPGMTSHRRWQWTGLMTAVLPGMSSRRYALMTDMQMWCTSEVRNARWRLK